MVESRQSEGILCCNISDDVNEWNKKCLEPSSQQRQEAQEQERNRIFDKQDYYLSKMENGTMGRIWYGIKEWALRNSKEYKEAFFSARIA